MMTYEKNARLLERYEAAKAEREDAERFFKNLTASGNNAKEGVYMSRTQTAAPQVVLNKKTETGHNFFTISEEINRQFKMVLIDQWEILWPLVIQRLKSREDNLLKECQKFIDEMQAKLSQLQS